MEFQEYMSKYENSLEIGNWKLYLSDKIFEFHLKEIRNVFQTNGTVNMPLKDFS